MRGAASKSAYTWNYLRSLGINNHPTSVHSVKEELHPKCVTEGMKSTVNNSFSCSAYVSSIKTSNEKRVTPKNVVEVAECEHIYLQRYLLQITFMRRDGLDSRQWSFRMERKREVDRRTTGYGLHKNSAFCQWCKSQWLKRTVNCL